MLLLSLWKINYFNSITTIVFYTFLTLISISSLLSFKYIFKMNDSIVRKLILSISSMCISLLIADFFLRFGTDKLKTYLEKNGFPYKSLYEAHELGWFYIMHPNIEFSHQKPEFLHSRKTNSIGLPDVELKMEKDNNELRIIALGDSFTESVGTTDDMTWVKNVERILSKKYPKKLITTFNCGVSGSDIIFEYILLKEKLLIYRPDIVIIALNTTDIVDIITRGGIERFKNDGTVKYNTPPVWEKLYATSFVFRLVIHKLLQYNSVLIREGEYKRKQFNALGEIVKIINKFKQLAIEYNFNLLIVLHPQKYEVDIGSYDPEELNAILRDNKIEVLDLLKIYSNKNQINQKNAHEFYWPVDAHHNTKGYQIMGQEIAEKIIEQNYIK